MSTMLIHRTPVQCSLFNPDAVPISCSPMVLGAICRSLQWRAWMTHNNSWTLLQLKNSHLAPSTRTGLRKTGLAWQSGLRSQWWRDVLPAVLIRASPESELYSMAHVIITGFDSGVAGPGLDLRSGEHEVPEYYRHA